MADNTTRTPGTGETWAADDIGGILYQRIKIGIGADGAATDWTGDVTNAGTFVVQAEQVGVWAVSGTFWQATQPVSGTFWQATQPVSGTFWQATQPVSLATVPSHDVTNAGTFATQPAGSVAHDAAATAVNPVLVGGYASAAAPANVSTTTDSVRAWHLLNGAQATVITAAGALVGGDATNGLDVDVTRIIPGVTATALGKAEDAVAASGDTGVMALAVRADTPAATGANGDYVPFLVDANGRQHANSIISPITSGGLTTYHLVSAATTNAAVVKASAGQLYGWYIYNSNAAARKLAFHNSASTPTAGASIYFTLVIPPTSGANVFSPIGIAFSAGIAITTVTGLADNDTAAVAANDLIINLWYF